MSKIIENRVVTVQVGSKVENSAGRIERLLPCEWSGAEFRYPHYIDEWRGKHDQALNVVITGRTFQYRRGNYYVRVRMDWVGDGEPGTYSEGWLMADPCDFPRVA